MVPALFMLGTGVALLAGLRTLSRVRALRATPIEPESKESVTPGAERVNKK